MFNRECDKNNGIKNKRMIISMSNEKTLISSNKYWNAIYHFINEHYDNIENVKFIIIGNGAQYIPSAEK
ncbi:hypothetical protein E7Y35_06745 [Spiroplasma sp. SV19]|nr:hypothetical protein E7Y35_06745 [Spiroplasma sp. SV19]